MSERPFFSLRYLLPGYAFILFSALVIYPVIPNLFPDIDNAQLYLGIAGFIVSGVPSGFLISQVWFVFYHYFKSKSCPCIDEYLFGKGVQVHRNIDKELEDYKLVEDSDKRVMFKDYIHSLSGERMKGYTQRRFDLYHIFGTTLVAVFIGFIFGHCLRTQILGTFTVSDLIFYDLVVVVIWALVIVLLVSVFKEVYNGHALAVQLSISLGKNKLKPEKARELFHSSYFIEDTEKSTVEPKE